jgi:hypothetical protein
MPDTKITFAISREEVEKLLDQGELVVETDKNSVILPDPMKFILKE